MKMITIKAKDWPESVRWSSCTVNKKQLEKMRRCLGSGHVYRPLAIQRVNSPMLFMCLRCKEYK